MYIIKRGNMKKNLLFLLIMIIILAACKQSEQEFSFPEKPITVIVYTGPGGLIDITARKFVAIASKYTDATFVVENKPGSGGIVAMKRLLQLPADGYTIFACTKSNISKIVSSGGEAYIDAINWAAMLMADPECVIVNKQNKVNSWPNLLADARKKNGKQLWVGPANGGLDHVTALKIWEKAGIEARWIPFKSGGKALAALLGEQGVAYVGNPRDVLGNDNLKIAAVSSEKRLSPFPQAPTFAELGIEGMDNEYMWRGFVYKKGTPVKIRAWYDDLFHKVTNDPDWQNYWKQGAIDVTYKKSDEFTQIVHQDKEEFTHYLQKIGILSKEQDNFVSKLKNPVYQNLLLLISLLVFLIVTIVIKSSSFQGNIGSLLIPIFFIILSLIFFLLSFTFPSKEEVSSAVVPRLWIFLLIPLNIIVLIKNVKKEQVVKESSVSSKMVFKFMFLLILYLLGIYYLGYFISTFFFLPAGILMLGYRKYWSTLFISLGWLLFSYFIFYKLLFVPLPVGKLIEMLL
ncbi:MAG: putative tricarboxylic transport rane protein [Candidatus Cloacimonadota bacterium]|jgi:tripartite-type tricarboxylate transporter receptor subunit TctC|nr:putative tricarboxylic transport rane protein [Candidatus Cloacimonadota bacterium]